MLASTARNGSRRTAAFDSSCARFADALRDAKAGAFDHWTETPRGALALVILLDQFSRNLHRESPEAFAADTKARDDRARRDRTRLRPVSLVR